MELTTYDLSNGMQVILRPKPTAPVVACNVWVGVGSADETPEQAGLAHVHEHMLFKGTDRRDVGDIAREVEASGGRINAFTSFDHTCYYVAMSSRYLEAGLDILSDAIRNSSFDAAELSSELQVIQEEIKRSMDNPSRVASLKLFETAYDVHPYRFPVIGTAESVASFERQDVVEFFRHHYHPQNMTLVVTGDFEPGEIRPDIERFFDGWDRDAAYEAAERRGEPEQSATRSWSRADDIQQTHLRVGFHIPNATHEDIPALDLLGAIMGYGRASHLVRTLQREREWFNSISATAYTPKDAGLFMVQGNYQLDGADRDHVETVRGLMEEVFRFREMRVSAQDLERARTMIESQEIYNKQTAEGLAMKLGHHQMVTGDPTYEEQYYRALADVTPEDIRRVARSYLTPENASLVSTHPKEGPSLTSGDLADAAKAASEVIEAEHRSDSVVVDDDHFVRLQLPDGPTLIVQEDDSVETFSIRGMSLAGSRSETAEKAGLARLMSELLTDGTDERTADEISHAVESMAGSISGLAGRNTTGLSMSGLSRFLEPSLEIFADCLLGAAFPTREFQRERKMQLQAIRGRRDKLPLVNRDQLHAAFFGGHPYSRPKVGTAETVEGLTVDDVRQLHRRTMRPKDLVLTVVGDVDAQQVASLAERHFVRPEAASGEDIDVEAPPERTGVQLEVGDLNKEQAHLMVGLDAPPLGSQEAYALRVLHAILSGQGGRLFYELRDRQSLAYSVSASTLLGLDASMFSFQMGTSPENIEAGLEGMFGQIRRVREKRVDAQELQRAQRYLVGNHDIGLQKNSARALSIGLDELYGLGYKRSLEYGDRIMGVTAEDVRQVARTYLEPSRAVVSITKPPDVSIKKDLLDEVVEEAGR
jgi:zinc protease